MPQKQQAKLASPPASKPKPGLLSRWPLFDAATPSGGEALLPRHEAQGSNTHDHIVQHSAAGELTRDVAEAGQWVHETVQDGRRTWKELYIFFSKRTLHFTDHSSSKFLACLFLPIVCCIRPFARFLKGDHRSLYATMILLDLLDDVDTAVLFLPGVDLAAVCTEDALYVPVYGTFVRELLSEGASVVSIVSCGKSLSPVLDVIPTGTLALWMERNGYAHWNQIVGACGIAFIITYFVVVTVFAQHEADHDLIIRLMCGDFDGGSEAAFAGLVAACIMYLAVAGVVLEREGTCKLCTTLATGLLLAVSLTLSWDKFPHWKGHQIRHTGWVHRYFCT